MITISQRSGQTVILGTTGEDAIKEALALLIEKRKELGDITDEQYLRSLLQTVSA